MVIYADVLVLVNFVTDFLLLRLSTRILSEKPRLLRIIFGALFGAFSSLYIFIPDLSFFAEAGIKVLVCTAVCFICFGFGGIRRFLKCTAVFVGVTLIFGGAVYTAGEIFSKVIVNAAYLTPYFNISPVLLITSFTAFYFLIIIVRRVFFNKNPIAKAYNIFFFYGKSSVAATALADSGNTLEDIMGISEVIVTDKAVAEALFGELCSPELKTRYRAVPLVTVSGKTLLDGYRCDKAVIKSEKSQKTLENPILAVSKTPLEKGYGAIINPKCCEGL